MAQTCSLSQAAEGLTLVSESINHELVTVSSDLLVHGSDGIYPSLTVEGDAALWGGIVAEKIDYFNEGEMRLENFFNFDASGLELIAQQHEWDDWWRLEQDAIFTFNAYGLTITREHSSSHTIRFSTFRYDEPITVNGKALATREFVDTQFAGTGRFALEFARSGQQYGGGGVASGVNAVSFGAGLAAGDSSWAAGTNAGNDDDGFLGPYAGGMNAHAYGQLSRALGLL